MMGNVNPSASSGCNRLCFVKMAKLIQILTYVLIYIMTADNYIMTTDNCLLTIGILVGLIYVAAEFFIMQRRSHKLSSLSSHSNYLITRFIFILYDLGLFISLLVYTGTVTETDTIFYKTCSALLCLSILLSLTLILIYYFCSRPKLRQDQGELALKLTKNFNYL